MVFVWIFIAVVSTALMLLILRRKPARPQVPSDDDTERSAANVAGKIIAAWHVPGIDSIDIATIAHPAAGISIGFAEGPVSPETRQALLVVALAGSAGEAEMYDGDVRTASLLQDLNLAARVCMDLHSIGATTLPWESPVDDGTVMRVPEGTPPQMADMLRVALRRAEQLIRRNRAAFERLQDLLLQKKTLRKEEITLVLATMVPNPS
jgi:ATP-dependent Zn protease